MHFAKESLKRDVDAEKIKDDNNLQLVYCNGNIKATQVINDPEFDLQFSYSLNVKRTVLILQKGNGDSLEWSEVTS